MAVAIGCCCWDLGIGGGTAEEGVVGCVDSVSEGACEVVGVAEPEPEGSSVCTEDSRELGTSETEEGTSWGIFREGEETVREGSSTNRELETRRRLAALDGNSASGTEYHGSCNQSVSS